MTFSSWVKNLAVVGESGRTKLIFLFRISKTVRNKDNSQNNRRKGNGHNANEKEDNLGIVEDERNTRDSDKPTWYDRRDP